MRASPLPKEAEMPRGGQTRPEPLNLEGFEQLDFDRVASGQPKHQRLRDFLAGQITAGRLRPGDALPTELQLAQQLGIARSTVRQAMASLERDNLVRRVHGKGTFVHELARWQPQPGLDVFALVLPETQRGYYPSLQRSFEDATTALHNQMLVCCSDNNVDKQGNIILQLVDKQVGGLAIVPALTSPPTPPYQIRQLQRNGIPVVFCHRRVEGCCAPLLAIPFEQIGRMAGEALVRRGHRRVAYFALRPSVISGLYEAGLRGVLEASGGALPSEHVFQGQSGSLDPATAEGEILEALKSMLARPSPITAIFATFDSLAELIYLLLMRLGVRVPEDVSIVSFGGVVRRGAVQHLLTAVTVDEVQIGREAAELLHRMRRGKLPVETEHVHVMPISLIDGQTLATVRA
jgi:DNA-binding LacI/PurR family transcriptional regulator